MAFTIFAILTFKYKIDKIKQMLLSVFPHHKFKFQSPLELMWFLQGPVLGEIL